MAVQAQLRQIGVDVRVRLLKEASAFDLVQGRLDEKGTRVRDYDAFLTNYTGGLRADDTWFLHSRNREARSACLAAPIHERIRSWTRWR